MIKKGRVEMSCGCNTPVLGVAENKCGNVLGAFAGCGNGFLLLLILFILLACSQGREQSFFFIIIIAIIAFGGVGRTFGFGTTL